MEYELETKCIIIITVPSYESVEFGWTCADFFTGSDANGIDRLYTYMFKPCKV